MDMLKNTKHLKKMNVERIRDVIKSNPGSTKSTVASATGLSIATCGNILNEMLQRGEIIQCNEMLVNGGRPANQFIYNKAYTYIAGIYVANESNKLSIGYVVSNSIGEAIEEKVEEKESIDFDTIYQLIAILTEKYGQIKAVGIGIPGEVDDGFIDYCDIKSFENFPLRDKLREKFPYLEFSVRNDMDFISYGLSKKYMVQNLAAVYFSKDNFPGAGFVIDGKVLSGSTMFAGEVSYISRVYGISNDEQLELLQDKEKFSDIASKSIVAIISIINPSIIVLMGDMLNESNVNEIKDKSVAIIPKKHMPQLILQNDIHKNYIQGLTAITFLTLDERY